MSKPLVSVLVMAYNHEQFIGRALDSIVSQHLDEPFEVLVGEDCSTDNTLHIVRDFEVRHPGLVRVVTSESNVGMHANHKRLVLAAEGEYVAYCEGDDWWFPGKLRAQLNQLRAQPLLIGSHTDFTHVIPSQNGWRGRVGYATRVRKVAPTPTRFVDLLERNLVQTCTLVLRRSVATDYVRSDHLERGYAVGDWPLCLYATQFGDLGFDTTPLAAYRRVAGSVTNVGIERQVERVRDQHRMIDDFADEARGRGIPGSEVAARRGHQVTDSAVVWSSLMAGRPRLACSSNESTSRSLLSSVHPLVRLAWISAARIPLLAKGMRLFAETAVRCRELLTYRRIDVG